MSIRAEKVASVIKQALAGPVSDVSSEVTKGMVTITSVKMSPDLRVAKVYVSIFNTKESPVEVVQVLEKNVGIFRSVVAKNVRLRFVPEIRFYFDDTLDQMEHIQKLLDSIKNEENDKSEDGNKGEEGEDKE